MVRQRQIKQNSTRELPQEKSRFQPDRSRCACLFRRHLSDYIQAGRIGLHMNLGVSDSKLVCDQPGLFSPITRDVSNKVCIFSAGSWSAVARPILQNLRFLHSASSRRRHGSLRRNRLYPSWRIFNKTSFKNALTCTSEKKIWFQVHLSWADRIKHRPWKPSEPTRKFQ